MEKISYLQKHANFNKSEKFRNTESTRLKSTFIKMLILIISISVSLFCEEVIFFTIVYSLFLVTERRNCSSICYVIFLVPLAPIISYNNLDLMPFIIIEFLFVNIIIFFSDIFKKKKNVLVTRSVLVGLIFILFVTQLNTSNIVGTFGIFCGILIIYILSYYKENLNLITIMKFFILGVIASIILGVFRPFSEKLISSTTVFYAGSHTRFCGVSHPNVLAGEIVIALGFLYYLVLHREIKITFYPLYTVFVYALILTLSKSGLIVFIFINFLFLIFYFVFNPQKIKMIKLLTTVLLTISLFILAGDVSKTYINRFDIFNNVSQEVEIQNSASTKDEGLKDGADNELIVDFTTGRSVLWKKYILKSFKNTKVALFGYGINAISSEDANDGINTNAHNTIIQILYYNGVIGLVLIVLFLVSCIKFKNISRSWLFSLIPIIAVLLVSFAQSMYNYSLFCIISMIIMALDYRKKEEKILSGGEINKEIRNDVTKTKVAILTPSFNRAKFLLECFNSLRIQTCKNFTWYIVDDGSTDETEKLIKKIKEENDSEDKFEINYIKKKNGGKHTAINRGLKEVKEEFVIILDSDDYFEKNAVEIMSKDLYKVYNNDSICGIGYLRVNRNKEVIGRKYTKDEIIDTFINQRYNKNTYGDKCELFKTAVLRDFPFPEFPNEKFLSETIVWCRISRHYKMIFKNQGIYVCEYQPNGLSDGIYKRLFKNPKGAMACYKELSTKEFKLSLRIKYTVAYIIYSLSAGMTFKEIKNNHKDNKFLINLLYLPAKIYFRKLQRKYD